MRKVAKGSFSIPYSFFKHTYSTDQAQQESSSPQKHHKSVSPQLTPTPAKQLSRSPARDPSYADRDPTHSGRKKMVMPLDERQLNSYKKLSRLTFGRQRIESIKKALDIAHQAQQNLKQRVYTHEYFMDYDKNPFQVRQPQQDKRRLRPANARNHRKQNIVEALNQLKDTDHLQNIKRRVDKFQSNHKKMQGLLRELQPKPVQPNKYEDQDKQTTAISEKIQADATAERQIDSIASIQEQSFFVAKRNRQPFDIFKILTEPNHPMFLSGLQQLQNYNFSTDSMHNPRNKQLNENIYKDLCIYARIAAVKNTSKRIHADYRTYVADLKERDQSVLFEELITVAKGQTIPETLTSARKRQRVGKMSDKDNQSGLPSILQKEEISYRYNQHNKGTLQQTIQMDREEIDYFVKRRTSSTLPQHIKNAQKYNQEIAATTQLQEKVRANNIKQTTIMRELDSRKEGILQKQLEQVGGGLEHIDKKMRRNRVIKDQGELVRINRMIEAVRASKRFSHFNTQGSKPGPHRPYKQPVSHSKSAQGKVSPARSPSKKDSPTKSSPQKGSPSKSQKKGSPSKSQKKGSPSKPLKKGSPSKPLKKGSPSKPLKKGSPSKSLPKKISPSRFKQKARAQDNE